MQISQYTGIIAEPFPLHTLPLGYAQIGAKMVEDPFKLLIVDSMCAPQRPPVCNALRHTRRHI